MVLPRGEAALQLLLNQSLQSCDVSVSWATFPGHRPDGLRETRHQPSVKQSLLEMAWLAQGPFRHRTPGGPVCRCPGPLHSAGGGPEPGWPVSLLCAGVSDLGLPGTPAPIRMALVPDGLWRLQTACAFASSSLQTAGISGPVGVCHAGSVPLGDCAWRPSHSPREGVAPRVAVLNLPVRGSHLESAGPRPRRRVYQEQSR